MIGIHVVHRRLAELQHIADQRGGYHLLTTAEQMDLRHCMIVNAKLVRELDELKQLAFVAHQAGDMDWQMEICGKIDEMEAKMI